ncbi:MAG: hypothetical protein AAGI07_18740 [Bacteroidota bacterium]
MKKDIALGLKCLFLILFTEVFFSCKPSQEESRFVKQEGVYGTIAEAVANKADCHTLIIRNLNPDGSIKGNIQKLSSKIAELTNLKKLFIYGLPSQIIPAYFNKLKSLEELHIIYAVDRSQPLKVEGLATLPELQILKLEDVGLEHLPILPTSIRVLDLKNNRLTGADFNEMKPSKIESLNLAFNPIDSLPFNFSVSFKYLKSLDLEYCLLKYFPSPVFDLAQLNQLSLASNNIAEIPEEPVQLPQLNMINLFNCPIEKLPNTFLKTPNLKTLWLPSTVNQSWLDTVKTQYPDIDIMVATYKGI